jgi:hypothetical protein
VALDLVQLLPNILRRHELIENVAGFDASWRQVPVVILKILDCGDIVSKRYTLLD